jgi:hypothetical protein
METTEIDQPVPISDNRALTELVQSRVHLDAARRSLRLSLEIFERLEQPHPGVPLLELQEVLVRLEDVESALNENVP